MVTNMLYGSPLRDTRRLQDEVNRLFQSVAAPRTSFPAINVYAHQDGIVITAELPGVKQDALEITVHRDTVTLRGDARTSPKAPEPTIAASAGGAASGGHSGCRSRLIRIRLRPSSRMVC
jgi:HSP20 family molecular chaperone IbpA